MRVHITIGNARTYRVYDDTIETEHVSCANL